MPDFVPRSTAALLAAMVFVPLAGCDSAYPEIVVTNHTHERLLMRDISFNGCLWAGVLAYGESTTPQRCMPGSDRVHFKKLDVADYCADQADNTADGGCGCTIEPPTWFNYQTVAQHSAGYGDFKGIEVRLTEIEQDFSTTGPYGH